MPWPPNKREFLARRLRDFGLLRLAERLGRRPSLVILCYHRIGDPAADPFYHPLVSATPGDFRLQLRALKRAFTILDLDDLMGRLDGETLRLDGPTAMVTFDDGYRDNLDLAAPILKDEGVPATVFLTTGFLVGDRLPWWDHVAWAIKQSPRDRLELERPEPIAVDLPADRSPAVAAVIGAYLRADRPADPGLLAHLDERAGVEVDEPTLARRLFLGPDGPSALASAGLAVGAHTISHRKLATLSEPEQSAELIEPRRVLSEALGRPVDALAYPYGGPNAFDARTRHLAREAGYRLAFALRPRAARPGPVDPMDLPRFNVMAADSPTLLRARLAMATVAGRSVL